MVAGGTALTAVGEGLNRASGTTDFLRDHGFDWGLSYNNAGRLASLGAGAFLGLRGWNNVAPFARRSAGQAARRKFSPTNFGLATTLANVGIGAPKIFARIDNQILPFAIAPLEYGAQAGVGDQLSGNAVSRWGRQALHAARDTARATFGFTDDILHDETQRNNLMTSIKDDVIQGAKDVHRQRALPAIGAIAVPAAVGMGGALLADRLVDRYADDVPFLAEDEQDEDETEENVNSRRREFERQLTRRNIFRVAAAVGGGSLLGVLAYNFIKNHNRKQHRNRVSQFASDAYSRAISAAQAAQENIDVTSRPISPEEFEEVFSLRGFQYDRATGTISHPEGRISNMIRSHFEDTPEWDRALELVTRQFEHNRNTAANVKSSRVRMWPHIVAPSIGAAVGVGANTVADNMLYDTELPFHAKALQNISTAAAGALAMSPIRLTSRGPATPLLFRKPFETLAAGALAAPTAHGSWRLRNWMGSFNDPVLLEGSYLDKYRRIMSNLLSESMNRFAPSVKDTARNVTDQVGAGYDRLESFIPNMVGGALGAGVGHLAARRMYEDDERLTAEQRLERQNRARTNRWLFRALGAYGGFAAPSIYRALVNPGASVGV